MAHILLSILAYGMLTIAVFQSLLLLLQDHQLKHKHPSGLIKNFPPLQTMESLLFGFLWAGWLLLSLSLLSGALFINDLFAQHLAHKTILSCFAWVVFAVLLRGRHQLGWGRAVAVATVDLVHAEVPAPAKAGHVLCHHRRGSHRAVRVLMPLARQRRITLQLRINGESHLLHHQTALAGGDPGRVLGLGGSGGTARTLPDTE